MRIGCVTRHQYPTGQEVRVARLTEAVAAQGSELTIFCPGGIDQAVTERVPQAEVIRLRTRLRGLFGRVLYAPTPVNPLWYWWLAREFRRRGLEIIVVRDLRLAIPALVAAKLARAGLILDLGEHYPGMVEVLGKQTLSHHVTRNKQLISWLERFCVRHADVVWVVVEENLVRLRPIAREIEVIGNYPSSLTDAADHRCEPVAYTPTGEPLVLMSFGVVDNIRGLDLAIDALRIVIRSRENVQLWIYGGGQHLESLKGRVRTLSLQQNVAFKGWVEPPDKYRTLSLGHIGLLLHRVCELTEHTIPNKLFDYMSVGLPIICTPLRPVVRVVSKEECGLVAPEDAEELAAAIVSLVDDLPRRRRFSENGYKAVRAGYRWSDEAEKIQRRFNALRRA